MRNSKCLDPSNPSHWSHRTYFKVYSFYAFWARTNGHLCSLRCHTRGESTLYLQIDCRCLLLFLRSPRNEHQRLSPPRLSPPILPILQELEIPPCYHKYRIYCQPSTPWALWRSEDWAYYTSFRRIYSAYWFARQTNIHWGGWTTRRLALGTSDGKYRTL